MTAHDEALSAAIATLLRDRRDLERSQAALAREHFLRMEQQASAASLNSQMTRLYARIAELEADLEQRTTEWVQLCEAHRLVQSGAKLLDTHGRLVVKVDA